MGVALLYSNKAINRTTPFICPMCNILLPLLKGDGRGALILLCFLLPAYKKHKNNRDVEIKIAACYQQSATHC
jgi:hypothetical protein